MIRSMLPAAFLTSLLPCAAADDLPARAEHAAAHALQHYDAAQVELLADLVRFRTVHTAGTENADHPEFRAFADYVGRRAREFGLEFADHGAVLIVSLGDASERLGVVTHGDVQPADPSKWRGSPFELDRNSEPGRLIARGTEDDKAAIATALYAMKALRELGLPLQRRIELIVSLTEESDWAPFEAVLAEHPPPDMNIGIDASYPVVVAEKGWGSVLVTFAADTEPALATPFVASYAGGAFLSQVPEDATLTVAGTDAALIERMRERANRDDSGVSYRFEQDGDTLTVQARGKAAHSSTPEDGLNALAHVASLLDGEQLLETAPGRAVDLVSTLIGTDLYGSSFGSAAYAHPFMGPLTINLSTATSTTAATELGINLRAPAGKTPAQLEREIRGAVEQWAESRGIAMPRVAAQLSEAYLPERPPQVAALLSVFRHYTGIEDAEPISIGGGTNARLLPNAVNFGPAMPGVPYTGHSEHEFITREQMSLNLRMYTAMLAWLAAADPAP
jgi:dipeptidase D